MSFHISGLDDGLELLRATAGQASELEAACTECGEQLVEELQLLVAMPQVKAPVAGQQPLYDNDQRKALRRAQQRGARFSLWCCGQITKKCNAAEGDTACPSWVEAVRHLRRVVETTHSNPSCVALAAQAAAAARSALGAKDAFAEIMGAQLAYQRAAVQVRQLEAELMLARMEEQRVAAARRQLEARLKDTHALLAQLQLKVGQWITVQARERWSVREETHWRAGHYWLARVVDAGEKHHLGDGVVRQITAQRETIQGTTYTRGDIAIAVEWYDRVDDTADGLKFVKWVPPSDAPAQCVVNSTELRAIDLDVRPCLPTVTPPLRTQQVRRSGRLAGVSGPAPAAELPADTIFEIGVDPDVQVRTQCW